MEDKAAEDGFRGEITKNVTYYAQVLEFYSFWPVVLNLQQAQNHLEGFLKQIAGPQTESF